MRNKFEREMNELADKLVTMSDFVISEIKGAMEALRTGDRELAHDVSSRDHIADELELAIERQSMCILLREQPVASDLRTISTALKLITDMERISDQGADIAEILSHIPSGEKGPEILYTMADKCVIMVTKAMDAFVRRDLELARAVIGADDEIDRLFLAAREELAARIAAQPAEAALWLDFFMIAKYLERIGDHAQNIAEWVEFLVTGMHKQQRIL
ncbi:MAG TPA: phosphate signaling complex protein PhoU [Candidatus Fimadaptatus faecigallinarum]|uniref:Phosphate-specific transport system accessory protein PhoU n=1 Tax=Candidatus Fimadaptatus faecigallinarum TaxID=2840814 RepID=A0A9D1LQQ3_9FIRM|nr:phosphate signaling complex protein PhoU [Candidatus Fimadaptatus faecigallinarum]